MTWTSARHTRTYFISCGSLLPQMHPCTLPVAPDHIHKGSRHAELDQKHRQACPPQQTQAALPYSMALSPRQELASPAKLADPQQAWLQMQLQPLRAPTAVLCWGCRRWRWCRQLRLAQS